MGLVLCTVIIITYISYVYEEFSTSHVDNFLVVINIHCFSAKSTYSITSLIRTPKDDRNFTSYLEIRINRVCICEVIL